MPVRVKVDSRGRFSGRAGSLRRGGDGFGHLFLRIVNPYFETN